MIEKIDKDFGKVTFDGNSFALHNQSFSRTDTCKTEGQVGIVYPFDHKMKINGAVTASSIIDHHDGDRYLLKHTEVRVCNSCDNNTLLYEKIDATIPILIHDNSETNSDARSCMLFEQFSKEDISLQADSGIKRMQLKVLFINNYKDFEPSVIISDKNIKKKEFTHTAKSFLRKNNDKMFVDDDFPIHIDELECYRYEFASFDEKTRKEFYSWYEYALFDTYADMNQALKEFRKEYKIKESKILKDTKKASEMIDSQSLFDIGEYGW